MALRPLQRLMKRRQIRQFLDDPQLSAQLLGPLDRQTDVLTGQLDESDIASGMNGDYSSAAAKLQANLLTNEGLDSATVGTGGFGGFLQQLLAILLPLLTNCIPTPTPAPPKPAEVLAYLK